MRGAERDSERSLQNASELRDAAEERKGLCPKHPEEHAQAQYRATQGALSAGTVFGLPQAVKAVPCPACYLDQNERAKDEETRYLKAKAEVMTLLRDATSAECACGHPAYVCENARRNIERAEALLSRIEGEKGETK